MIGVKASQQFMKSTRFLLSTRQFSSRASDFKINHIGVVGAGQMGTGIGIVASRVAGANVTFIDPFTDNIEKSRSFIDNWCRKEVKKRRMENTDATDVLNRIEHHEDLGHLHSVDFVIEAASEDFEVKKKIFQNLSSIVPDHAVLATNTSSISISKIGGVIPDRAHQVIGMHFMNPVPVMKLVEVITALQTSADTLQTTLDLAESMNKICTKAQDVPGFIANRLLMPYINEAVFALYENIGTREDIDVTMKLGTNVPMGPLELADFIGLDTCLSIMRVLYDELSDSKYRPCPLLVKYVHAGRLGRKTGRGFYEYHST